MDTVIRRYLLLTIYFGVLSHLVGQEVYYVTFMNPHTISRTDLSNCASLDPIILPDDIDVGSIALDVNFHPDGRMYIITHNYLLQYDFTSRSFKIIEDGSVLYSDLANLPGMAIDEEGHFAISGGDEKVGRHHIVDYDLRSRQVLQDQSSDEWNYYIVGRIQDYFIPIFRSGYFYPDSSGFWVFDLDNNKPVKYFDWGQDREYTFQLWGSSVLYEPCNTFKLVNSAIFPEDYKEPIGHYILYPETGEVREVCVPVHRYISSATHTDFRQSPLRIDLDANNSSGHRTAGYYDTLTTCRKEVPLMDDDVEIYTCGQEVDYISFRLRYYDHPRLEAEILTADVDGGNFRQTSPSRWVWENPYGPNEEKIKDFLRSVRYHADWDPEDADQSRERVVMTTMHVGNDSTTSWSVYQLETDEVYAGRDTMITYCSPEGVIDLVDYLSPGASPNGRLEPVPAGGGTVIDARVDQEEEYLYIVEKGNCADTAVLKINYIKAPDDPETVVVCPGEGLWYKLPPASYSEINWWDGSQEDSIWLEVSRDTTFYVETVVEDRCTRVLRVPIRVREIAGLAGEDQTHTFCAGGPELDLNAVLPVAPGMGRRLEPALSGGDLIFRPGEDAARKYKYILSMGGCADTALITLEESATGTISLDAVRLCSGSEAKVGIPPGIYQNTRWWNGDTGESTTVTSVDSGPFTVEAEKDGCTYQGEVDVTMLPDVILPDDYHDQITICTGQPRAIPVFGLDSVGWRDTIYYPGDEITINQEGEHTIRGYQDGCYAEKSISADEQTDPSADYTKTIEWCPQIALTIPLPEDNALWAFRWKDGHDSSNRTIDSIGRYPFLIESDFCTFTGYYDVIESTDCDDDCTVSIPNAITPNGDGINDNLEVFSSCDIRVIEIRIFDKWGGELYRVQGGEVESIVWADLPPGVVMLQVRYETGQGVVKTVGQGVMVVK